MGGPLFEHLEVPLLPPLHEVGVILQWFVIEPTRPSSQEHARNASSRGRTTLAPLPSKPLNRSEVKQQLRLATSVPNSSESSTSGTHDRRYRTTTQDREREMLLSPKSADGPIS